MEFTVHVVTNNYVHVHMIPGPDIEKRRICQLGCKGKCGVYRSTKLANGQGRYSNGQRRCQICSIWIKWEGLWCPCCGYRLRTKPRNKKFKETYRKKMGLEGY